MPKNLAWIFTSFATVFLALIAYALWSLATWLPGKNAEWLKTVEVPTAEEFDGVLFKDLYDANLIWVARSKHSVKIRRINCSTYTVANPELVLRRVGEEAKDRRLVYELCRTKRGDRLRTNIDLFNSGGELFAIRDNRYAASMATGSFSCRDGSAASTLFVPAGCLPSEWAITLRETGQSLRPISTDAIPILPYLPLAMKKAPAMSGWAAVRPYFDSVSGDAPIHRAATTLKLTQDPLNIHIIGYVDSITAGDKAVPASEIQTAQSGRIVLQSQITLSFERLCLDKFRDVVPCTYSGPERTSSLHMRVDGPVGADLKLAFDLRGSGYVKPDPNARPPATEDWPAQELEVRNIEVTCPHVPDVSDAERDTNSGTLDGCLIKWDGEDIDPPEDDEHGEGEQADVPPALAAPDVTIIEPEPFSLMVGNVEVLNESGELTEEGLGLGYGEILGFGVSDLGSYAEYLSQHEGGSEVRLTPRPGLQERLREGLPGWVPSKGQDAARTRADVVIMDAEGPDAGRILAFASSPDQRPERLSAWDLRALSEAKAGQAAFPGHHWNAHDNTATPGSTFKIVTALAGIQYVLNEDDAELERILLSHASLSEVANRFGWIAAVRPEKKPCRNTGNGPVAATATKAFPVYDRAGQGRLTHCVFNYSKYTADTFYKSGTDGCRPGDSRRRTGMCEALQESSNQFFAGLAFETGKSAIYDGSGQPVESNARRVQGIPIAEMAARLSLSARTETTGLTIYNVLDPRFQLSRGRSVPIKLRVMDPVSKEVPAGTEPRSRAHELALSGIGQAVDAPPVAMAAAAASIATRRVVRPTLVEQAIDGAAALVPLIDVPIGKEGRFEAMMGMLEAGMKAAVQSGTAKRVVAEAPSLAGNVYAKTGSAQIEIKEVDFVGAWLVGYVRAPGNGSGITEDISFACRVAPITEGGGGSVCGPLIGRVLADLDSNGLQ